MTSRQVAQPPSGPAAGPAEPALAPPPGGTTTIKTIGASGQISLGKEFAGRTVLIESSEPGVWLIRTARTIPDCERWLHQPEAAARLDRALAAMEQPPADSDLDALEQHLMAQP